jgi:DNA-binding MarR family transcriptional regulator
MDPQGVAPRYDTDSGDAAHLLRCGPVTMTTLSVALGISQEGASDAFERLGTDVLAERVPRQTDKRGALVRLTPSGRGIWKLAKRGAKPKPAHLRLVDGTRNATKHGTEQDLRAAVESSVASFGKLVRPLGMKGPALAAWKKYIEPASWLDASREPAAIAFCEFMARVSPRAYQLPRIEADARLCERAWRSRRAKKKRGRRKAGERRVLQLIAAHNSISNQIRRPRNAP